MPKGGVTIHGHAQRGHRSREYRCFCAAKSRCTNKNGDSWKSYGGRGIEFRFGSVLELIAAIGPCPSEEHSLDRKDNDGHYEPGNVRWGTRQEQSANRRKVDQLQARIAELEAENLALKARLAATYRAS